MIISKQEVQITLTLVIAMTPANSVMNNEINKTTGFQLNGTENASRMA